MINKFLKLIATISIVLLSITSLSIADDHVSKKKLFLNLEKILLSLVKNQLKENFYKVTKNI